MTNIAHIEFGCLLTMVIVSAFGALLVVGWLLFFFGLFVPRNTP